MSPPVNRHGSSCEAMELVEQQNCHRACSGKLQHQVLDAKLPTCPKRTAAKLWHAERKLLALQKVEQSLGLTELNFPGPGGPEAHAQAFIACETEDIPYPIPRLCRKVLFGWFLAEASLTKFATQTLSCMYPSDQWLRLQSMCELWSSAVATHPQKCTGCS